MEIGILIIIGIIGGLIAGFLGLGGGIFYILFLPYIIAWFGIPADQVTPFVVANSLIGIAFASVSSLLVQFAAVKKYLSEILLIGVPAVAISLLVTKYIVQSSWFSVECFNILVVFLMIFILFEMLYKGKKRQASKRSIDQKIKPKEGLFSGSVAGLISALSGLGGGIIIVPLLNIYLKQNLQKTKTISLAVIFMSSFFVSIENIFSHPHYQPEALHTIGYIIPGISIPLVMGVIVGGPLGIKFSNKLTDKTIKMMFMFFVLLVLLEKFVSLF